MEVRLAELLTSPALAVAAGPPPAPGAAVGAGLAVASVAPRTAVGGTRPVELRPRELHRISPVTARVAVTVRPATGAGARAGALAAATVLWWRCEDGPVASGAGFPRDPAEGYLVEAVHTVAWRTPDATDGGADHVIELDVDGAVWPREAPPEAGVAIDHAVVRFAADAPATPGPPLAVRAGRALELRVEIDLRSFVLGPDADRPAAAPREVVAEVVPLGADDPAGSLAATTVALDGDVAVLTYQAGPAPGHDEVRVAIPTPGGRPVPAGLVEVEVVP